MSVLIKGMEMPKSCDDCKLKEATASWWICDITSNMNESEYYADKRPSNCPLIEIPTPHGRLIDADALQLEAYNMMFRGYADDRDVAFVNFNLQKAPTIIESETDDP